MNTKPVRIILFILLTAGCSMPLSTSLLDTIQERVDEYNFQGQPDLLLLEDGIVVPNGSSCDAFSDAAQGEAFYVEFTLKNTGEADLHLRDTEPITRTGPDADLFTVHSLPDPLTIEPGQSVLFTLRLELDSSGTKSALIAIHSDDPVDNPYEFTVSNTALPEIEVLQGSTILKDGEGIYDFGTGAEGEYRDVLFSIKNSGQANLNLTGTPKVSVDGTGFSVISQPDSPVPPADEKQFTIRLQFGAPGPYSGAVTVQSDDSDESTYTYSVEGTSLVPISENKLASGTYHILALKDDGTVWAWGGNQYGAVGNGNTADRRTAYRIPGLNDIVSISAGGYHSLALKSDGTVWAWGWNYHGQLGDGTTVNRLTPIQVPGLTDVAAIAGGSHHTVVLKNDGTVWECGVIDIDGTCSSVPVRKTELSGIVAAAAGNSFSLAVKSDGTVWAWGGNHYGQLGDGTTDDRNTPVQVSGLNGTAQVDASFFGHSMALKHDGSVWSWGNNSSGQLGDASEENRLLPVRVHNLAGVDTIGSGFWHSLAVKSDGTAWAWGSNGHGQIGQGTTSSSCYTPRQVLNITNATLSAGGYLHSAAMKSDGTVWTWGSNSYGQLGNGTSTDSCVPVLVAGF